MASTKQQKNPTDVVVEGIVQLLGVGALALLAGVSDEVGKIIVVIMAGIMLIWLMTHTTQLKTIVGKVGG